MLGLIPIRDGVLPAGAAETVAECGGRALLAGSTPVAAELPAIACELRLLELGQFDPGRWADTIAAVLADDRDADVIVVPASPDGRDLAPRLAHAMDCPLLAGAVQVTGGRVRLARSGGLAMHEVAVDGPVIVTLQPGVRGVEPPGHDRSECLVRDIPAPDTRSAENSRMDRGRATVVAVLAPDVATMDLAEAHRIVGGGAGLDGSERFQELARVGTALGASMGATRVITDRAWVGHERQIGTTGVVVDPRLYLAFGISGAVQHTAGLGDPDHIVSVNTDPHCPMMQMADLAVVSDANAVVHELARRLGADA